MRRILLLSVLVVASSLFSVPVAQSHPGVRTLHLWYSDARQDNYLSGTYDGDVEAEGSGYYLARAEARGFVSHITGTVPLYLFWHPGRGDNFTTATAAGISSAYEAGYVFVRIEGYVLPA